MKETDEQAMRRAISASREALEAGDRPYGATLVGSEGEVLHVARNRQQTLADPTAHAETMLIREVAATLGAQALLGATVVASGEPCPMCAGALFWAGIRRIVYGAPNDEMTAIFGGDHLPLTCSQTLAGASPPVIVEGPLLADEALAILRDAALDPD